MNKTILCLYWIFSILFFSAYHITKNNYKDPETEWGKIKIIGEYILVSPIAMPIILE